MAAGRPSPPGPCCPSRVAVPSVHQSLPEMDFERGIWSAARDGDERRVLELLERRGGPSQPDTAGYTALHYASRNGHLGVCRLLLQRGARCDARTPGGATPLHRASYCGHLAVARLLLAHGADPAAADGDGLTSLHKAAEQGHPELCALLLRHSPALVTVADVKGRRPRDVATAGVRDLLDTWDQESHRPEGQAVTPEPVSHGISPRKDLGPDRRDVINKNN
ncbi:ankyrin repeat domain-containing protein 39 [Chroicocephalus ridibundus]|uniref:ankyrin repeat domain-containing protein 39 n=1 Tax=Chroicocephalus ridibundus TaxID=1192867 RepID=UPI002FDD2B95